MGILLLLDQQCKMGGAGSDTGFLGSLFKSHQVAPTAKGGKKTTVTKAGSPQDGSPQKREVPLSRPRPRGGKRGSNAEVGSFVVHHYAGDIEYVAGGMLVRNNDSVR
jgi:hypothetical protein